MDNYILLNFNLSKEENKKFENKIYDFDNIGFLVDNPEEKIEILSSLPEWETSDLVIDKDARINYEVYFEASDKGLEDREKLKKYLSKEFPSIDFIEKEIDNSNWEDEWKKTYKSFNIGDRILIKPSWEEEIDTDKIVIEIEPKMAFGSGTHETTSLCMEYVEDKDLSGMDILDIGCGSGILSILAKKLGAKNVLACDIDPIAVSSTIDNAKINEVDLQAKESNLFDNIEGKYDLIFANILAEILVEMIGQSKDYIKKSGILVLSGIINEKAGMVKEALSENDYEILDQREKGEWTLLVARSKDV
ncbi:50S ribosomal protein L11 methyltransferase [uncultured Helcococcus sp.]|uniref:50S ribosomal protein L11 methyltransferase n=1 Tax=uncultured Helcococcus sp. TaxID=1072508 RepID=UPI00288B120F|nr:50S ribosomal protein L11 methyltransferase [uncultured Helcococcus sp.]